MAKVIGIDPKRVKQATCHNCASIVEYTLSETKEETRRDYTGDADVYRVLICPKCGYKMDVA